MTPHSTSNTSIMRNACTQSRRKRQTSPSPAPSICVNPCRTRQPCARTRSSLGGGVVASSSSGVWCILSLSSSPDPALPHWGHLIPTRVLLVLIHVRRLRMRQWGFAVLSALYKAAGALPHAACRRVPLGRPLTQHSDQGNQ